MTANNPSAVLPAVAGARADPNRTWQTRAFVTVTALVMATLLSGCHHRTRVSRRSISPPVIASSPRSHTGDVPFRHLPPVVVPQGPVNDNAIASGRLASTDVGFASWYGPPYANHPGANGEIYDQNAMTAAHRTLPMGTVLQVTNLATNVAVTVKVTDRGPFIHGRVLDLSLGAAKATGVYRAGVAQVRMDVVAQGAAANLPGKWCVQIGAFLNREHAYHLQVELQRRYAATAKVIQFQGPTGYWVRINPAGLDRARALQVAGSIQTFEPDALPYVVRLD